MRSDYAGGSSVTFAYDPAGNLLTALTDPRAGGFTFGYDPLGRRITLTRPNGTTTAYTYDLTARLMALAHTGPRGTFEALAYTYDPAGNRTADSRNRLTHLYSYDPLDQLTQVQEQKDRSRWKTEEGYTYDAANRLTTDGKATYTYDANGNLVEKRSLKDGRVTTYTYDAEDRLSGVVTPKAEVSFSYDPLGRRIEKRVVRWHDEDGDREPDEEEEGTPREIRYLYDQEDILATFDDAGRELARYTHGPGIDEPLAESRSHRTRFHHADVLGSVVALTEKQGHPVRHYRYSAFGLPEDHKGDPQPYRFTGREWDKEVDLYYYRARYYAPGQGRFLTEDPIGLLGGLNIYRYVLNNPLALIDPLGLDVTVTLYRGARGFGHIGVRVNASEPTDTVGHYPLTHSAEVLAGVDVSGEVTHDLLHKNDKDILDTITIPRTAAQDWAMERVIRESLQNSRYYNLYFWNCTAFVEEVLRAGGVGLPGTNLPSELMRWLQQKYGNGDNPLREVPRLPGGFAP